MSNVQSVERALTLLNELSDYPDGLQITRLAERVGLTKSTTHRLLSTLMNLNYIVKDENSDKYKLGLQVIYLSRNVSGNLGIIEISRPYLEQLSNDVNETIHLCVEDNRSVLYIDKIESNQTVRMYSKIGSRRPMYCTGVGKILLSGMDLNYYEKIVSEIQFEAKTPNTITSKEELDREVALVKKREYALDNIEVEEGIRCIAAPIYDQRGKIIASFSISGPSSRITMDRVNEELVDKVKEKTYEISRQLGFSRASLFE